MYLSSKKYHLNTFRLGTLVLLNDTAFIDVPLTNPIYIDFYVNLRRKVMENVFID